MSVSRYISSHDSSAIRTLALLLLCILFVNCRFEVDKPDNTPRKPYEAVTFYDQASGLWYQTSADTSFASVIAPVNSNYVYSGIVYIPASITVNGVTYYVNTISENAFASAHVTSISMSANLTTIEAQAFTNCDSLVTIKINSATMANIDNSAFASGSVIIVPSELVEAYTKAYPNWTFTDGTESTATTVVFFDEESELWFLGQIAQHTAVVISIPNKKTTLKSIIDGVYWGDIYIPDEVDYEGITYEVIGIDDYAFADSKIITLRTPETLTSIGEYAVARCSDLTSVRIDFDGVAVLSTTAFDIGTTITVPTDHVTTYDNKYATCGWIFTDGKEVPIEDIATEAQMDSLCVKMAESQIKCTEELNNDYVDVTYENGAIAVFLFNESSQTAELITVYCDAIDFAVPKYVTYKDKRYTVTQVSGCGIKIKSIALPSTLKIIGDNAFRCCSAIESVVIPESVIDVGKNAFELCTSLRTVHLSSNLNTISEYSFSCTAINTLEIPSTITTIEQMAFFNCTELTKLTIGTNVQYIGNYAFKDCTSLELVNFNAINCTKMGYGESFCYAVFDGCTALTDIICDSHVRRIPKGAFTRCPALRNFVMGKNVQTVESYAFEECPKLTSIDLSNVKNLGSYAFRNCSKLRNVTLGNDITGIYEYTFFGCTAIQTITIPQNVAFIEQHAFGECTALSTLYFNATNCQSMMSEYELQPAFSKCSALANLLIGDNVESIPDYAFYDCSELQYVTLGSSLQRMGFESLYRCPKMKELHARSHVAPTISANDYTTDEAIYYTLGGITQNCTLYVPAGCSDAYSAWKSYFPKAYIEE